MWDKNRRRVGKQNEIHSFSLVRLPCYNTYLSQSKNESTPTLHLLEHLINNKRQIDFKVNFFRTT